MSAIVASEISCCLSADRAQLRLTMTDFVNYVFGGQVRTKINDGTVCGTKDRNPKSVVLEIFFCPVIAEVCFPEHLINSVEYD